MGLIINQLGKFVLVDLVKKEKLTKVSLEKVSSFFF